MRSIPGVKLLSLLLDTDRRCLCMCHTAQTPSNQWLFISDLLSCWPAGSLNPQWYCGHSFTGASRQSPVKIHCVPSAPGQCPNEPSGLPGISIIFYGQRPRKPRGSKQAFLWSLFFWSDKGMFSLYEEIVYSGQVLQAEGKSLA